MWRGVREVEEGPNCTSERPRKAQPWRPLSSGGHCTDSWQCGQTGAKTIPLLWWQSFPPVAPKPPNLVTSCFNEETAVAAGWQISRIKVVKRSRGQMERVELYWPKTQTMFLMNFRVKHTSLSLIIHSAGTVHLNRWQACSKEETAANKNYLVQMLGQMYPRQKYVPAPLYFWKVYFPKINSRAERLRKEKGKLCQRWWRSWTPSSCDLTPL